MGTNKGGRPFKEIPQKEFEKLCAMQCTKEEICGFFDITDKTLDRWVKRTYKQSYSEVYRQKRANGRISLRRSQFKLAEKSAAMAIFLGKNYLGQSDKETQPEEHTDDGFMDALREGAKAWQDD